jgi:urease accessory protein
MITINKLIPQSRGLAAVLLKRAATVELDWDVRQKSRFDATDSQGRALGGLSAARHGGPRWGRGCSC